MKNKKSSLIIYEIEASRVRRAFVSDSKMIPNKLYGEGPFLGVQMASQINGKYQYETIFLSWTESKIISKFEAND